jgi:predicted nucleic acid-binding protein
MNKVFIDSNITVYAYEQDDRKKHDIANALVKNEHGNNYIHISTQVLNEVYSVLSKHKVMHKDIAKYVLELQEILQIMIITTATINASLRLKEKYRYSWWDSLILASSLENKCDTVITEDMQDGQIIENTLTIRNPFIVKK